MTAFNAQAHVKLDDPETILTAVCLHLQEHGAELSHHDGVRVLNFGNAQARFSHAKAATILTATAASIEDLYHLRRTIAAHILEFCSGPAPAIRWQGDGEDLQRPPNFRILEVVSAADITPHMRRIRLTGNDLARFAQLDALHLNILAQHPDLTEPQWPKVGLDGLIAWDAPQRQPFLRKYTVRHIDTAAGILDVDFVLHADAGPGSAVAETAQAGDRIGIIGPGGGGLVAADWYLFAGDETALPAIARMLENLPPHARGQAFIEVADDREIQELSSPAAIEISWLLRNGRAPGTTSLLPDAIRQTAFPDDGLRIYVWAGCEFAAFRAIRSNLRGERGLVKDQHLVVSYWRRGESG